MHPPAVVPLRRTLQTHPIAFGAFACFLALSLVETVRLALVGPTAASFEAGLYGWEEARSGAEATAFRWTAAEALLVRPVEGAVIDLTLYVARPDLRAALPIALEANGRPLAAIEAARDRRIELAYYLPPLLGFDPTEEGPGDPPAPPAGSAGGISSGGGWRELGPWRRRAVAPLRLRIDVGSTFVPAALGLGSDRRRLGVGLGEIAWRRQVPAEGLGFHPWESDALGKRFRWTSGLWASQPVLVGGKLATFEIRVDHPDVESHPVGVDIYWNERRVHRAILSRSAWATVTLDAAELTGEHGVLSFKVERTWSPARSGLSDDGRELGVAVSEIVRKP